MLPIKRSRIFAAGLGLALLLRVAPLAAAAQNDAQMQADVQKALDNKRFKSVSIAVRDGNVSLGGTVDLYADKELADNRIHHVKRVSGVDNEIARSPGPWWRTWPCATSWPRRSRTIA